MRTTSTFRRVSRPRAYLALALAGALVMSACSGDDDDGGGGAKRKNLRYAYDLETGITNLDPSKSGNTCDQVIWYFIYDSLLRVDSGNKLQPGLATEWATEGRTITLTLAPDVKFHDGSTFDAEAVKKGLDYNNENPNLTALDDIGSIEVVDATTVKIELTTDRVTPFLYSIAGQDGMMVAPSAQGTADKEPIGAGPFSFENYKQGQSLLLKRYDGYFQAEDWKLDGIEFVQAGFGPPNVTKYQAGDADLIRFLAESYDTVKGLPDTEVGTSPSGQYAQLEFRLMRGDEETPFANVKVRQAVSHAINRAVMNDVVEGGRGEVTWQHYNSATPFYQEELDEKYPYDPDRARELLAEAGYPDGFEFTMAIPGGGIQNMERQSELIQDDLAAVGITANIERINPEDIATQYYIAKRGEAFSAQELPSQFAPSLLNGQFGTGEFVAIHDGAERQDMSDMFDRASVAASEEELIEITQEGERTAVEEALDIPIYFAPQYAAWNTDRVAGTPVAPPESCIPTDLRGVSMK